MTDYLERVVACQGCYLLDVHGQVVRVTGTSLDAQQVIGALAWTRGRAKVNMLEVAPQTYRYEIVTRLAV